MEDLSGKLERLAERMEALEQRVEQLEHPAAAAAPAAAPFLATSLQSAAELSATVLPEAGLPGADLVDAVSVFTVLGRALLGVAGAYLLRAVAERSAQFLPLAAAVSLAYAFGWMVIAAREKSRSWLPSTLYAATSAALLGPMLWELTLRFQVLPPWLAAVVVAVFTATALSPVWKRHALPLAWAAGGVGVLLGLALLEATHALVAFGCALLVALLVAEFASLCGVRSGARVLAAGAADLAVWIAIFVDTKPAEQQAEWPQLGPGAMVAMVALAAGLFLIAGASVCVRTLGRREPVSWFDAVQATIAFLLAASALLSSSALLSFGSALAVNCFGVGSMALGAAGSAVAFMVFRSEAQQRNRRVFALWSTLLLASGAQMALPAQTAPLLLGLMAVVAAVASVRLGKPLVAASATLFLAMAAGTGGLLSYALVVLGGNLPFPGGWKVWLIAACAIGCAAILHVGEGTGRALAIGRVVCAALGAIAASALLVHGLTAALGATAAAPLAMVRTTGAVHGGRGAGLCRGAQWKA